MPTVTDTRCSFCAKEPAEIAQLVAGPGVYICNECVDLCVQIFADSKPSTPSDADAASPAAELPYWETMTDDQLLGHLPKVASVATQVEENLRVWVQRARDRRISWARIGQSLGMARQSAWERFSGEE